MQRSGGAGSDEEGMWRFFSGAGSGAQHLMNEEKAGYLPLSFLCAWEWMF